MKEKNYTEKIFKENIFNAAKVGTKDVFEFEFELKDEYSPDDIEFHYPDCGICTKAKLEGRKLVGKVEVAKANPTYQAKRTPLQKYVTVALNDGRPFFVAKEGTKERTFNKEKQIEKLNIVAVVTLN